MSLSYMKSHSKFNLAVDSQTVGIDVSQRQPMKGEKGKSDQSTGKDFDRHERIWVSNT